MVAYLKLVIGFCGFAALGYNLVVTWPREETRNAVADTHSIYRPTIVGDVGYSLSEDGTPTYQVQRTWSPPR